MAAYAPNTNEKTQLTQAALNYASRIKTIYPELDEMKNELYTPLFNYFTMLHQRERTEVVDNMYKLAKNTYERIVIIHMLRFIPELAPVLQGPELDTVAIKQLDNLLYDIKHPRKSLYENIELLIDDPFDRTTNEQQRRKLLSAAYHRWNFRMSDYETTYENHMRLVANRLRKHLFHKTIQFTRTKFAYAASNAELHAKEAIKDLFRDTYVILMFATLHVMEDKYKALKWLFDRVPWGEEGNGPEGWPHIESEDDGNDGYSTPPPRRPMRSPPETVRRRQTWNRSTSSSSQTRKKINWDK